LNEATYRLGQIVVDLVDPGPPARDRAQRPPLCNDRHTCPWRHLAAQCRDRDPVDQSRMKPATRSPIVCR